MIVRIATEGQYRMPDDALRRLNELDNATVDAAQAGDEERFAETLDTLIAFVRERGEALEDAELIGSDVILPPADTSLEEARHEFTGEGLIPG